MKRLLQTTFLTFRTIIDFQNTVNFPGIVKASKKPSLSLVDPTNKYCAYPCLTVMV